MQDFFKCPMSNTGMITSDHITVDGNYKIEVNIQQHCQESLAFLLVKSHMG